MANRIISGVIASLLVVIVATSNVFVINIAAAAISFIAVWEMYNAVGLSKKIPLMIIGCIAALACTFGGNITEHSVAVFVLSYIIVLFLCYMIFELTLSDIAKMFFLTVYICYFFSCLVFVRTMEHGALLIWLIFIGAWITDTFAFAFGMLFGKHKLWERISPKKTFEGAIGGGIFTVLAFWGFGKLIELNFQLSVNYTSLLTLGVLCSVFSQLGDLAASRIKREYNLKDFGNLIPGHGGILDRCDSFLFVAPLVYTWLLFFGVFV